MKTFDTIIIGGGISGMTSALALTSLNKKVCIIEKEVNLGGNINNWSSLFPGEIKANQLALDLTNKILNTDIKVITSQEVLETAQTDNNGFFIKTTTGACFECQTVIVSTGYKLFDASKKEELGYTIYKPVITPIELEQMFKKSISYPFKEKTQQPNIAILHCVGSRDVQSSNLHCSKLCCMLAVKYAIKLKKEFPEAKITNFYIDLRLFGIGYEALYQEAQKEHQVSFIRGRISEVALNSDETLRIKAEDTLLGLPLKGNFDLLVLMTGIEGNGFPTTQLKQAINDAFPSKFLASKNPITEDNNYSTPGVFLAGSCKGQMTASEAISDGNSAALQTFYYLKQQSLKPINLHLNEA